MGGCIPSNSKRHPISANGSKSKKLRQTDQKIENSSDTSAPLAASTSQKDEIRAQSSTVQKANVAASLAINPITASAAGRSRSSEDSDSSLNDPYKYGGWSRPLENLWTFKRANLQAEKQYNREMALMEPHCCLCQYFVSKSLASSLEVVPTGSNVRRLVSEMCFYKTGDKAALDVENRQDLDLDVLITCSSCDITVHASCYSGKAAASIVDKDSWLCDRCMVRHN